MTIQQTRDVSLATVPVLREADMARYLRAMGRRVVEHRGRQWEQILPGFYRPVHPLARLSSTEATRPTRACWGFQACLADGDAHRADAAVPAHLIGDLDSIREEALPGSRRAALRKARRRVELVQLTGPDLLQQNGYDVYRSYHRRTGYGSLPTPEEYQSSLEHFCDPGHGLVLAGIVNGRLGGYISGHAVDGTAYIREVVVASEVLDTQISIGLTYEFFFACRRSTEVKEVVHGFHTPENAGLCQHKDRLGMTVERVPARVVMPPGIEALMRRSNPGKAYRLTGRQRADRAG